jgi:hypothetical protein
MTAHAQNNLPSCNGNFTGPCFGVYEWPDGMKYVGQFKDGKRNGQGTFSFPSGEKYVGQYRDDKRNGQGINTYPRGEKYVGQFKDDKRHGQGTLTFPDGEKYVGQWKDEKYDGFGTYYYANGSIKHQGLWSNDKFIQAQTPPAVTPSVVPKPPVNNPQDSKRQKCIRLGLVPGSADFQQCIN